MNNTIAGQGTPLLSIIIPTRERCEFLRPCIQSALSCADPTIEVVVSDNASADETRAVVAEIADPRLMYVNTGKRVPMHDNYEFGLNKSRGRYVMFIGDDDAVLPNRIAHLLSVISDRQPDVVNWHTPSYAWPGAGNGEKGLLTLKPLHMRGGEWTLNADELLQGLADGEQKSYRIGGAKIYYGCVSRGVIEKVRARIGRYFFAPWPDVSAAIFNLFVIDTILMLGTPCTLAGTSSASNGWFQRFLESRRDTPDNPHAVFVNENVNRTDTGVADARIRPVSPLTYFTLVEAIRRMPYRRNIETNDSNWIPMIESEISVMLEPARSQQAGIVDLNLAAMGKPPLNREWSAKLKYKVPRIPPPIRHSVLLPNRLSIVSRPGLCSNVFEAAVATDRILGNSKGTKPGGNFALAIGWAGALARAGRILGSAKVPNQDMPPLQLQGDRV